MRLVRLKIQQLPGIDPGFELQQIEPGVNLVTGPNAIGKSSLIRALRYLIAPASASDPLALTLEADFSNGEDLTASRNGSARVWKRQGQVVDPPALPDRDSLHCYWLTMENLVRVGEDDADLIEQLHQALAGGYDLRALRCGLFERKPRVGQNETRELREAERQRREIEADYGHLRQREQRLPELQREIDEARRARSEHEALDRALQWLERLREHREAEGVLETFPEGMDRLDGHEIERLDKLEAERERLAREHANESHRHQEAQHKLQQTGLAEARPDESKLDAHRKSIDDAQHRQSDLDQARDQRQQLRTEEDEALQALGGSKRPALDPESVSRAESLAQELQQARKARDEIAARLRDAADAPHENEIERHRSAVQALTAWLGADGNTGAWQVGITAVVGGVLTGMLAAFVQPVMAMVGGGVAALGVGISLLIAWDRTRPNAQKQFAEQDLTPPSAWQPKAVQERLAILQQELDRLRELHQRALAAREDQTRLDQARRQLDNLEQQKQELAEELDFDPALTAAGIDRFVRLVDGYSRARQKRQELDQRIRSGENRVREAHEEVKKFIESWGLEVSGEARALDTALAELRNRTRTAGEAERERDETARNLERLDGELRARENEVEELYHTAGLEPGERRALEDRVDQLENWKAAQQRLRDLDRQARELQAALAEREDLIERAEAGERQTLEADRDRARQQAEQLESLISDYSSLETEVRQAGRDRRLEEALADEDEARAALEDRLQEQTFAEAGLFLLDDVEAEHRSEHEPEVLADARRRFESFTHHAWSLDLYEDDLKARDLQQNEVRELTDLSSGTRMQLLLAVRLAWTHRLEKSHEPLPLFLDEALTTSDEQRFAAVADSLTTLARDEGRQIFYLSARRHELGLWEDVTGVRPNHIDMAEIRLQQAGTAPMDYRVPQEQPLPAPAGQTVEEYAAELGVPPVDPSADPGQLHLFHIMRDDLQWLHRLMEYWRLHRLGQLELFLNHDTGRRIIPDANERHRLWARCQAARAWFHARNIGRGYPVDRGTLEDSGAVSETYIDRVTALAEQYDGNAQRLIEGLDNKEVKGFQKQKIQDLREYLEANGYISNEEPLNRTERERQTLMEAGNENQPEETRKVVHWLEGTTNHTEQQSLL